MISRFSCSARADATHLHEQCSINNSFKRISNNQFKRLHTMRATRRLYRYPCTMPTKQVRNLRIYSNNFRNSKLNNRYLRNSNNHNNSNNNHLYYSCKRHIGTELLTIATSSPVILAAIATVVGIGGIYWYLSEEEYVYDPLAPLDFERIREEIRHIMYDPDFDDGCCAPLLLRLAFNQAATYSRYDLLGGTNGATIRFEPERSFTHNRGLSRAMMILESVKKKFPKISYSDLWVLASYVAIEEMGGPRIEFKYGRTDATDGLECVESSRFPPFEDGASVLLDWFDRLGLTDREGVALMGAHSCGRVHTNICGIDGSWTDAQILSTDYYKNLKFIPFVVERRGVEHYFDPANPDIVLLPIEGSFFYCARVMKWGEYYAFVDPYIWLNDFATVFKKITEFGCDNLVSTELNSEENNIYDRTLTSNSIDNVIQSTEIETNENSLNQSNSNQNDIDAR